jgi:hypothetical protein
LWSFSWKLLAKATANITVVGYTTTYDGMPHEAAGAAIDVNNTVLAGLNLPAHTNSGTYIDTWTFSNPNCNSASGTVIDTITKANANIAVIGYNTFYNAISHIAIGAVFGVNGVALSGLDLSNTVHINICTYTDVWTFTDTTGNYNNASGTVVDTIAKANATVNVTPYSVTYNGNSNTATGSVTGIGGMSLSGLNLGGTVHTNAGTYTDSWTFTDTTGTYNSASGTVVDTIAKANANIVVVGYNTFYNAVSHSATGAVSGVDGSILAGLNLNGTAHINVGTYTDVWTFTDTTGNYNNVSGTVVDTITPSKSKMVRETVLVPKTTVVKATVLVPVVKEVKVVERVKVGNKWVKKTVLVPETVLVKKTVLVNETKMTKKTEMVKVYYS